MKERARIGGISGADASCGGATVGVGAGVEGVGAGEVATAGGVAIDAGGGGLSPRSASTPTATIATSTSVATARAVNRLRTDNLRLTVPHERSTSTPGSAAHSRTPCPSRTHRRRRPRRARPPRRHPRRPQPLHPRLGHLRPHGPHRGLGCRRARRAHGVPPAAGATGAGVGATAGSDSRRDCVRLQSPR